METKDSYAFPLYHRVGQMAQPVIASRYWILIVLIVAILLYLPFLPSGFFQDDYGLRLNFSPAIYEKNNIPAEVMRNGPLNLYGFSWDSSARFGIQQDKGSAPSWRASDQIKTNFFRPLSSLTLALDFSLWPDTPLLMHIHSLLWFCLLIVLTYQLYRSVSGSAVVAGTSILLFVMSSVLSGPVGWISNRHAVSVPWSSACCACGCTTGGCQGRNGPTSPVRMAHHAGPAGIRNGAGHLCLSLRLSVGAGPRHMAGPGQADRPICPDYGGLALGLYWRWAMEPGERCSTSIRS